jgi:peptidoglycan/xylan/chitin deacetylase (PgdA/CDA1 family)
MTTRSGIGLKRLALVALKYSGMFAIGRRITRRRLRILCYHGLSVGDQHEFSPILFMQPRTFERRMRLLVEKGWRVVDLATGVRELAAGIVPDRTVVVTIDDGWVSTLTAAAPILERHKIPATVYVTTYYAQRRADVFNVAVYYMLWKTRRSSVTLATGHSGLDGVYDLTQNRNSVGQGWIAFAEKNLSWEQRQELLPRLAEALGLSSSETLTEDRFRIVDREQVRRMSDSGLDVQLHTHRHRLPSESFEALEAEVLTNKRLLDEWTGKSCTHFCYPSGIYSLQQSEWLARLGLDSSTTCDPGTNPVGTHPHRLRRILDNERWSDLEFEAALSGVTDLFQRTRLMLAGE